MTDAANAAVLVAPGDIRVQTFALPNIGQDDGLLDVEACGVCAADVPVYDTGGGFELPVVLGHEIVGRVNRIGERAARRWGVRPGDRVVLERWIPCGRCERCYRGDYRLCVPRVEDHDLFYGGAPTALEPALYGGYASHVYLHPDAVVYPVSDDPPAVQFALFTPLGNAISWLQRAGGAGVGSSVVIQGPGQEGLAAVIAARLLGAGDVVVIGLPSDEGRLALARELGASATLVAGRDDLVAGVRAATSGRGGDVVLDVTSTRSTEPVSTALDVVSDGGTVVLSAHHEETMVDLPTAVLSRKTVTIRGVHGRDRASLLTALRLIASGALPLAKLTTHEFPLVRTQEALETVARRTDEEPFHVSVVPGS